MKSLMKFSEEKFVGYQWVTDSAVHVAYGPVSHIIQKYAPDREYPISTLAGLKKFLIREYPQTVAKETHEISEAEVYSLIERKQDSSNRVIVF